LSLPDPPEAPRPRLADPATLAAIVLAGVALRAWEASRAPLWFDEIYTTWAARGGFAKVLATLAGDVHPPLHTLLVAAWMAIGGESTPWLRSLSLLFGAATIVLAFLLGRAMFGRRAGLVAAAMLACHPVHVYFSQEARVYALFWFELVGAWWLGWRWLADGRARDGAGYVVFSVLALYTHYLSGLLIAFAAAGGLALAWTGPGGRRRALAWVGLHLAVAALFLPQLPVFITQNARLAHEHWSGPPDARDLRDWLRHAAAGAWYLVPFWTALGVVALAHPASRRAAAFLAWLGFGPVFLAFWLGTRGAHLFTERYMNYAVPALVVVAAGGLAGAAESLRGRGPLARATPWVLLVALLAFEIRGTLRRSPIEESTALAKAAAVLRSEARPGDVVFCADSHALAFLQHYHANVATVRLLWLEDHFPYYEGALVIPDSLRVGRDAFDAPRPPGSRWWGVRVRHGGRNGPETAAIFDSVAAGRSRRYDQVTLWGPESPRPRPAARWAP